MYTRDNTTKILSTFITFFITRITVSFLFIEQNNIQFEFSHRSEVMWPLKKWREKEEIEKENELLQIIGLTTNDVENVFKLKEVQWNRWKEQDKVAMVKHLETPRNSRDIYEDFHEIEVTQTLPQNEEHEYPATSEQLTQWYINRAKEIEETSGQVCILIIGNVTINLIFRLTMHYR